jgi:hypothetical protein
MNRENPPMNTNPEDLPHQTEPSVWDWFKSLLRAQPIPIPGEIQAEITGEPTLPIEKESLEQLPVTAAVATPEKRQRVIPEPAHLRLPLALLFAFMAQIGLDQKMGSAAVNGVLYLIAGLFVAWATLAGDFELFKPQASIEGARPLTFRPLWLGSAFVFSVLTYLASAHNRFRITTLVFWSMALLSIVLALWDGNISLKPWRKRLRTWLSTTRIQITLDRWGLILVLAMGLSIYFRVVNLVTVPPEMTSDHAEKLYDVVDILNGHYSIFFTRNTGREALQFYMAAATTKLFGTGISFITLKIGIVAAGILALPFIYLLGKEVAGKEGGLAAMALTGIGYWPNVISRTGLRFTFYPLFTAMAFYFLIRGLRRGSRNDFLRCGLVAGIALQSYSPARVVPVVIAFGVVMFLLHRKAKGQRWAITSWLIAAGLVALVVFIPLMRYALEHPDIFMSRMQTRIFGDGAPLDINPWAVFLKNVWNGLLMYGKDGGAVWVNCIPFRPALDWVTGALFHLGIVILVVRYVRYRHWADLFLLLSIPILQLPSTLAIAFPAENPATNRAAGAYIPAFIAAGLAMTAIWAWVQKQMHGRRRTLVGLFIPLLLFTLAASENYSLVFDTYADRYSRTALNTSEAGYVIRDFAESIGDYETAHVVSFPYWLDTRLVGIWAGKPHRDYETWPKDFENFIGETRSQLFILNPNDTAALESLRTLFPDGRLTLKESQMEGRDLLLFVVPATKDTDSIEWMEPES